MIDTQVEKDEVARKTDEHKEDQKATVVRDDTSKAEVKEAK